MATQPQLQPSLHADIRQNAFTLLGLLRACSVQIFTLCTPSLSAHLHCVHTFTVCTHSLCAHLLFVHTFTLCTPSLCKSSPCAHLHPVRTFTLCTPSLCAHIHFVHTFTLHTFTLCTPSASHCSSSLAAPHCLCVKGDALSAWHWVCPLSLIFLVACSSLFSFC